jgi:hypothetical protein
MPPPIKEPGAHMPSAKTKQKTKARRADVGDRFLAGVSTDVPKIYFNASMNALSTSDVTCVLERNGSAVCVLNMSFTTAKSFAGALGQLVSNLETQARREIMTVNDVERFISGKAIEKVTKQ